MGSGWKSSDVLFLDYYKSSIMAGTNRFKGNNNFILIESNNGFAFDKSFDEGTETIRHGYSIDWFAKTIYNKEKTNEKIPLGYYLTPNYLRQQWGSDYNENQYHGVINGSRNRIENLSIRDSLSKKEDTPISSNEWNYTEPWYGKKLYQGLFNDYIFQNAFATTIEYKAKSISPYQNGKDYIQAGTKESVIVSYENRADNETIPLDLRVMAFLRDAANTIFITNNNSPEPSYNKDKDGYSMIKSKVDLYVLGYNSDYCDISTNEKIKETMIDFTISSALWDKLAGSQRDSTYIYCDLWFVGACDKEHLLGDGSETMYHPFSYLEKSYRDIKLIKGELFAHNNIFIERSVKIKNPYLACNAGDDRVIKLQKGQEQTNVTLYGKVTKDNGKSLSYYW
jgi:hypothetical protein